MVSLHRNDVPEKTEVDELHIQDTPGFYEYHHISIDIKIKKKHIKF